MTLVETGQGPPGQSCSAYSPLGSKKLITRAISNKLQSGETSRDVGEHSVFAEAEMIPHET